MNNVNYIIFDILCDYLKGKKSCANFRLISKETKIMSTNLYNRHYSAYRLNKDMIDIGFDSDFIECDYIMELEIDELLKIFAIGSSNNIISSYKTYIDRFNPVKNNKLKHKIHIRRQESMIFSLALDWPEKPKYRNLKAVILFDL